MSLFKVCTFWTAQCSDCQSNYDAQLLHCCRFGIGESEKDYIVVGSHSGYLSVFKPNAIGDPDENFTGFTPTDQLLEIKLSNPIIQLSSGKFLMYGDAVCLSLYGRVCHELICYLLQGSACKRCAAIGGVASKEINGVFAGTNARSCRTWQSIQIEFMFRA